MSIYMKLNAARAKFHALKLQKTGENKFAGYKYFELGDFLIPAMEVFAEHDLCAIVSFDKELATMRIVNLVDNAEIVITSPMGSASLKGCHEVQNIGAVETYQRRYLWVAALEIVEHDAVDASDGPVERKPDVAAILRGISNAQTLDILRANYEAAMQMLPQAHQAAIKKATNARKAELTEKEPA
ncbi:ERF family protein [Hydrogenophaga sp.]|uniref:ERF family protein n=1 Tax=Hydrogenophaga sp. TaxID=1904254 RepID=UPI00271669AA|nr:ERF family protein [Hydrogenophaga sp.]MDO9132005.1 ERF family protein [Hydrogenophaga sp.]